MRKIVPIIISIAFFVVPFVRVHADISTNLITWYKFDEGSGSTALDSGSNGFNATEYGSPPYITGKIGPYALSLSTSTQYATGTIPTTLTNNISVSAWVRWNGVSGNYTIWFNGNGGSNGYGMTLGNGACGAGNYVNVVLGAISCDALSNTTYTLPANQWVQLVIVRDSGTWKLYVNGTLTVTGGTTGPGTPVGSFQVGSNTNTYDFPGSIDDVRLYSRALSATDVTQLYNYTSLTPNEMTSPSYVITINSINFGGDYSTSTSYQEQDTIGEIATGNSSSTNYAMGAGYQQMYTSYISIGSLTPVNLGHINGLSGGMATGTLAVNITTDNPAGYSLSVQATSSPAMQTASGAYFTNYSSVSTSTPDYSFAIASNTSAFGFSVNSLDALGKYNNNGSVCNTGFTNTAFACWDSFSTSSKVIAQSTMPNNATGTVTTLDLEAKVGTGKLQDSGTYTATITVTAITL